jgi:hypothetical protein
MCGSFRRVLDTGDKETGGLSRCVSAAPQDCSDLFARGGTFFVPLVEPVKYDIASITNYRCLAGSLLIYLM